MTSGLIAGRCAWFWHLSHVYLLGGFTNGELQLCPFLVDEYLQLEVHSSDDVVRHFVQKHSHESSFFRPEEFATSTGVSDAIYINDLLARHSVGVLDEKIHLVLRRSQRVSIILLFEPKRGTDRLIDVVGHPNNRCDPTGLIYKKYEHLDYFSIVTTHAPDNHPDVLMFVEQRAGVYLCHVEQ